MNLYSVVRTFSLYSLLCTSAYLSAMNNNATDTKIAEIQRDYDAIKANRPSFNRTNTSPIEDIELYIAECEFTAQEAVKYGETEIACDLRKKIGQASNFIDKLTQD